MTDWKSSPNPRAQMAEAERGESTRKRAPHTPGRMNKLEQRFLHEQLEMRRLAGEVLSYHFEALKFRVGTDTCWYLPDFMVYRADGGIEAIDVKGHAEGDALVKVKACAQQYPAYEWSWWSWGETGWKQRRFGL
jgi:hypothetical protein